MLTHHSRLEKHEERLTIVENTMSSVDDIKEIALKILKYIKVGGPSIVSAAIAAGIVNGKLGAFFNALLGG